MNVSRHHAGTMLVVSTFSIVTDVNVHQTSEVITFFLSTMEIFIDVYCHIDLSVKRTHVRRSECQVPR